MNFNSEMRYWAAMVLGLVLLGTAPVSAFYFKGWPGDGLPREETLFSSQSPRIGGPSTGLFDTMYTPTNPNGVNTPTSTNPTVPEPATGLLAGAGILLVVLGQRMRRKFSN